jgi:hypothetical protein
MHWLQVRLDRVSFYSKSFLCYSAALLSRFVVSQDENLLVHVAQGHRIPAGALDGHREEGQVSVVRASIARFGYVRAFTDLLIFRSVVTRPFVKSEPELGNQMPLYIRRVPPSDESSHPAVSPTLTSHRIT